MLGYYGNRVILGPSLMDHWDGHICVCGGSLTSGQPFKGSFQTGIGIDEHLDIFVVWSE